MSTVTKKIKQFKRIKNFRLRITPVPSPNSSQLGKNVTFDSSALTPATIRRGMKRKHLEEENIYNFQQLSKSYIVIIIFKSPNNFLEQ